MMRRSSNLLTRIVCIILCLCMLIPMLASCSGKDASPDVSAPSGDTPGGDTPGGDTPGGDTPGGNTPGGDTPGGDTPGGNTPGGDTPGGDTPGGDTETTYYKVSFATAIEEYKNRVSESQICIYR